MTQSRYYSLPKSLPKFAVVAALGGADCPSLGPWLELHWFGLFFFFLWRLRNTPSTPHSGLNPGGGREEGQRLTKWPNQGSFLVFVLFAIDPLRTKKCLVHLIIIHSSNNDLQLNSYFVRRYYIYLSSPSLNQ